jgi:DNA-binding phage protein
MSARKVEHTMARTALKAANDRGALRTYSSYSFVEKDPIIDKVRTIVARTKTSYATIESESGVTRSTVHAWFHGKTMRPQFATVAAVISALGYDVQLVPHIAGHRSTNIAVLPRLRVVGK